MRSICNFRNWINETVPEVFKIILGNCNAKATRSNGTTLPVPKFRMESDTKGDILERNKPFQNFATTYKNSEILHLFLNCFKGSIKESNFWNKHYVRFFLSFYCSNFEYCIFFSWFLLMAAFIWLIEWPC